MRKCAEHVRVCVLPMRKNDNWKRLKFKLHWQWSVWHSAYGKNVFYGEFSAVLISTSFKLLWLHELQNPTSAVITPLLMLTGQYYLPRWRRQQHYKLRHFLQWWGFPQICTNKPQNLNQFNKGEHKGALVFLEVLKHKFSFHSYSRWWMNIIW